MKVRGRLMRIIFVLKGKIRHIRKKKKQPATEGKRQIKISSEQGWKNIWTLTTRLPMLDQNTVSGILIYCNQT